MAEINETTPGITINRPTNMPSIYVEGISQIALGFPNSRIILNSSAQRTEEGEVHQQACELIAPTSALIEMVQALSSSMIDNKDIIKERGDEWVNRVKSLVDSLHPQ